MRYDGRGNRIERPQVKRAYYLLSGDLIQMSRMEDALRQAGFRVARSDVYPGFYEEDKERYLAALRYLFDRRIEGWWNQEREMVQQGTCTQREYDVAIGRMTRDEVTVAEVHEE